MSILQDFRSYARSSLAPATVAISIGLVATFLITFLKLAPVALTLAFVTDFSQPWGLVTYPFAFSGDSGGVIWLVLEIMWFWGFGGSVERDLGTPKFVATFFATTLLGALCFAAGGALIGHHLLLGGALIPISAITVIWGTRNPTLPVMLMMVLPIVGRWLAWLTAAIVFFRYGADTSSPLIGFLACVPLAVGYWFASNRIPGLRYAPGGSMPSWPSAKKGAKGPKTNPYMKKSETLDQSYYDDVKRRELDRAERERLRKLFEGSLKDDDAPDK